MAEFEFIKTSREIIGEIEDRYDIKTEKSIISKEEAIEFLKEKNVFCSVGAVSQNKGERIYFTLNKKYVVEIWDKKMEGIKVFSNFKDVLSFLAESYPEKNKIVLKLEIISQFLSDIGKMHGYNVGENKLEVNKIP